MYCITFKLLTARRSLANHPKAYVAFNVMPFSGISADPLGIPIRRVPRLGLGMKLRSGFCDVGAGLTLPLSIWKNLITAVEKSSELQCDNSERLHVIGKPAWIMKSLPAFKKLAEHFIQVKLKTQ